MYTLIPSTSFLVTNSISEDISSSSFNDMIDELIISLLYFFNFTNLNLMRKVQGFEVENFEYNDNYQTLELDASSLNKLTSFLNLEVVNKNEISDRVIIEGYSNKLKDYVVINGRKVNIQLSIFDNKIIMGYPLINGSF